VGGSILFRDTLILRTKRTKDEVLTSFRVRLAFGALLGFCELSSEALRLPEASEGIMEWSWLAVMVEVMFIGESDGCCDRIRVCRARWAGRRRAMSAGRGRFPQTGLDVGLSMTVSRS
jgi:hypothetical protein